MNEIPVYLFFGFMDSGKTTIICDTLLKNGFADGLKAPLIIACEDGEIEYDEEKLSTIGAHVVMIEEPEDFTGERLKELDEKYKPDAVFIEFNGTWESSLIYEMEGPVEWTIVQSLCMVDASTFEMYLKNMGTMMREQLFRPEVVIFNRCTDDTPKAKFRANVKSVNRPAQIVYERADGTIDDSPEELPYDISQPEIDITDADYAIWFSDCMEHPKTYDGKVVNFRALVYNPKEGKGRLKPGVIVPGRFVMTCCVEDTEFRGMKCKVTPEQEVEHKSWIDLKAKVKYEFAREYKGKGPVLYPVEITPAQQPEDPLCYFS